MAIVNLNKKQFEKEIGKLDEKMKDRIAMFGTPLEAITDEDIQIEVFPNRPDMLSYHGFKRSFLGFLDKKTGLKEYKINKPEKDYSVIIDSSTKNVRPYTACAIVKGLELNEEKIKEIIEIQEKLHITLGRKRKKAAIGIYPLEKIKLPIIFRALEPDKIKFIPLDSEKEMSGLQILEKHSTGREYAHLLAGKSKFPVFMDSNNNILSMPPIINSNLTGKIIKETKDVFVECSGFDFEILKRCLNIIVTNLADMGGEIYQMSVEFPKEKYAIWKSKKETTPNLQPEKMKIKLEDVNKLLGLELKEKQIKEFLEKMGYSYVKGIVSIPAWRTDILHEVDLIEDIAIAYGYENFIPEIPSISTTGQEDSKEIIKRKISEILARPGMLEVSNYHLSNKNEQFRKMGIPEKQERGFIEVEESKTDYNILRKNLSSCLLRTLSSNIDSEYPQKIFEIGKVFESEKNIKESERLAGAISPGNFTEARQIIEYLFRMIDMKIELKDSGDFPKHFIDGRVAEVTIDKKSIGFIGEIHPKILKNWKIKMPVTLFEIGLEEIFKDIHPK